MGVVYIDLDISFGKHRSDKNWRVEYLTWPEFVGKLRKVRRTGETIAEYNKMDNIARGRIKDGPAFVGGLVRGGRRKKENVDSRSLITLDADHIGVSDFMFDCDLVLGGTAYVVYSTHSHRPQNPKYRLAVPVDRAMTPDEYGAVSRKLAELIGLEYFDKTTFEVHRLMYLPSCSNDATPVLEVNDGEPLAVDSVLAEYADWRDPLEWPRHENDRPRRSTGKRMEDPAEKQGVVGAFCRCYTISEAISRFLPGVYEPTGTSLGRYTYVGASSHGGLVVYDEDVFAYSHHESDPCSGREVNSFDLVRIHKFGKLDDQASEKTNITKLPSYIAMSRFVVGQPEVKKARLAELTDAFDEDEDEALDADAWEEQLEFNPKTHDLLPTATNVELILSNGVWGGVLAYDAFNNAEVIRKGLPWRGQERLGREYEPWKGSDDDRLQHWFAKVYKITAGRIIKNAFTEVTRRTTFHPIKDYIAGVTWDGVERAEALFITLLGANDTHYVRQVTRKMLLAAVTRIYQPGCKFDEMLVLVGAQGAGKSSLLAKLGGPWFSDSLRTFENKEAGEHLQYGWIFELGELSAMKRSEIEDVKAFLSKTEDRYRVAYDRQVSDFPRKCVFFGTTNTYDFLKDDTGNRRFWPVQIDPKKAKHSHWDVLDAAAVGQLWAEVLGWYKAGEGLRLDDAAEQESRRTQFNHLEKDPREGLIQEWLEAPIEPEYGEEKQETPTYHNRVCAAQIWVECLGNRKGVMKPWDAKDIWVILRRIPGWRERERKAKMPRYGVQKVFEREVDVPQG